MTMGVMKKRKRKGAEREFINLFAINPSGEEVDKRSGQAPAGGPEEDEREMDEQERNCLKIFKENDQEIDELALVVVEDLKKVKNNTLNIDANIEE